MNKKEIDQLIRNRRAVFPQMYNQEKLTDAEIWQILENANWAPTHKKTEPWRFVVFRGEGLKKLGEWMAEKYQEASTEAGDFSEAKLQKFRERPLQAQCVMGICMQRDLGKRVPKWEELAAMSCAVENMWLTCTAYGIGCYWSTPDFVIEAKDFPHIRDGWRCKGLFYMGRWSQETLPSTRGDIHDKVIWVE